MSDTKSVHYTPPGLAALMTSQPTQAARSGRQGGSSHSIERFNTPQTYVYWDSIVAATWSQINVRGLLNYPKTPSNDLVL